MNRNIVKQTFQVSSCHANTRDGHSSQKPSVSYICHVSNAFLSNISLTEFMILHPFVFFSSQLNYNTQHALCKYVKQLLGIPPTAMKSCTNVATNTYSCYIQHPRDNVSYLTPLRINPVAGGKIYSA